MVVPFWFRSSPFVLSPDDAAGLGGAPPPPDPAAASQTPPPASPEPVGGIPSPPVQATATPEPQWEGVGAALKGMGLDLTGQFQDDQAILAHLALAYRQHQQYLPVYQQVLPYWSQFQQFMAAQNQPKPAAPSEPWYKAPAWEKDWEHLIAKDANGALVPVNGAPPDIVQRYTEALRHRNDFINKFWQDPIGSIKPGLEEVVKGITQNLLQEQSVALREQFLAQQFIQQNSRELFQHNAQGQPVLNPATGKPALSTFGQLYARYVDEAGRRGIQDVSGQQEYANKMARADMILLHQGQAPQAPTIQQQGNQAKENFLQQAGASPQAPNRLGTPPQAAAPSEQPLTLQQMLQRNLAANGFQMSTPITG